MNIRAKRPATVVERKIELSIETNDKYEERAIKAGRAVEDELERTLARCADYNASTPIYLDDDARNELTLLSGTSIRTPEDVITLVKMLLSIKVAGVEVPLHSQLLKRLESRRFGSTMQELISRVVVEELERFVGLR